MGEYTDAELYQEALDIIQAALETLDGVDTIKLAVRYESAAIAISQARRLLDIPIRRQKIHYERAADVDISQKEEAETLQMAREDMGGKATLEVKDAWEKKHD